MKSRMKVGWGWMVAATVLACGDNGGGETGTATDATTGGATTTAATTTTAPTTSDATTGDVTTGSGGATTSTTDPSTGTSTGEPTGEPITGGSTTLESTGDTTAVDSTGASSSTGPGPLCGDGAVDAGEDCDDGGESATCNADCSSAACGDGKLNAAAGEACDEAGATATCDADCSVVECGDGVVNASADEACDGEAPANASCNEMCAVECLPTHGDCNANLADGCEVDTQNDAKHCGGCNDACPGDVPCKSGKCVAVGDAFHSYPFEGRTVYIFKTTKCADLNLHATFCEDKGLTWWKAKTQPDAQKLIDVAFGLDNWHTWIQVFGAQTNHQASTVDGFNVVVDGVGCVDSSADGWTGFRKWACSFCEPSNNQTESCCWDKDHAYDWFVCEG